MPKIILLIIIGLSAGVISVYWINWVEKRKKTRLHQDIRDISSAEKNKQIKAAKEKGAFDKWSQNS